LSLGKDFFKAKMSFKIKMEMRLKMKIKMKLKIKMNFKMKIKNENQKEIQNENHFIARKMRQKLPLTENLLPFAEFLGKCL